jgi:hypothetical protein
MTLLIVTRGWSVGPSVGRSVGRSFGRSFGRSVGRSVHVKEIRPSAGKRQE